MCLFDLVSSFRPSRRAVEPPATSPPAPPAHKPPQITGPLLDIARGLFGALKLISLSWLLGRFFDSLKDRDEIPNDRFIDHAHCQHRVKVIDGYVLGCLFLEVSIAAIYCCSPMHELAWLDHLAAAFAVMRVIEIVRVIGNTTLFDQLSTRRDNQVASTPRLVLLALVNYIELLMCFGIIYAQNLSKLKNATSFSDAFYLSARLQLPLGDGGLSATSFVVGLTVMQAMVGVLMAIIVLARFVASLTPFAEVVDWTSTEPPRK